MGLLRALICALPATCVLVPWAAAVASERAIDDGTLLVLKNGKVVEGRITQNSGGYVVDYKSGRMLIPRTQVLMRAASRIDAYRRLKKRTPARSGDAHLALANWCLTNNLYTQARDEIRAALRLDASNGRARRMMVRLEEMLNPDKAPESKNTPTFEERIMQPSVKALAGLPRETARQFVGKIQPILMHNCATAGCHGRKADNGFRLSRVHLTRGSRRGVSERNLATTLAFVDPDNPVGSALLTKPAGNHGKRGQAIFRGRAGARQLTVLKRWVRDVAVENSDSHLAEAGARTPRERKSPAKLPPGYQATPAMKAIRSRTEQRRVINDIRNDGRDDVFDPAEFNRAAQRNNRGGNPTQGSIR